MPTEIAVALVAAISAFVGAVIGAVARPWGQDWVNRRAEERAEERAERAAGDGFTYSHTPVQAMRIRTAFGDPILIAAEERLRSADRSSPEWSQAYESVHQRLLEMLAAEGDKPDAVDE